MRFQTLQTNDFRPICQLFVELQVQEYRDHTQTHAKQIHQLLEHTENQYKDLEHEACNGRTQDRKYQKA